MAQSSRHDELEVILKISVERLDPRPRLATEQALKDPTKAGALVTPWVTKDSPGEKLVELEQGCS